MQDKKSFGKYIAEKRKEANLTQEELANKLYVIPTTISKWERGITYPDITVITNLCKELNISEHEFFTACDDEAMDREKREIQKYRTLKKWLFNLTNIGYFIGILTCFICNLVIDHKLSWFLIVLVGILISFSITSLPFLSKRNKYTVCKITFIITILVYLLLFVINQVNNGNWLLNSYLIATFVFIILWSDVLICTFSKISTSDKVSFSLILWAICIALTNPICYKVLSVSNSEDNIGNIICSIIMILRAIGIYIKNQLINRKALYEKYIDNPKELANIIYDFWKENEKATES